MDTRRKEIEDQRVTVEADIHKHIDCLQQALEQRRTELIDHLHQLTQQKLKTLAAQRDQCELAQTQLSSCLDYVEGSLKTGSEGEILAMKTSVLKQIGQIAAEFNPNTLTSEQEANIQLIDDDSLDLLHACKEFAGVASQSVYPEKCSITGLRTAMVERKQQSHCSLETRMTESVQSQSKTLLLNWYLAQMIPPLNAKSNMWVEANM